MREIVQIPVRGVRAGQEVGLVFKSNPHGYMYFSSDFPENLFKKSVPDDDFKLLIIDKITEFEEKNLKRGRLVTPSIEQALWAIAYMNMPFADVVAQGPVQFHHESFPFKDGKGQIRITFQKEKLSYFVEVVPADDTHPGIFTALCTNYSAG